MPMLRSLLRAGACSSSIALVAACGGKLNEQPQTDSGITPGGETDVPDVPGADPEGGPPGPPLSAHKLDLLIVVDGSPASAEVEARLANSMTALIKPVGVPYPGASSTPFDDVHVAVISASLGSFGTSICDPSRPHQDDGAHRMPRLGDTSCTGLTADSLTWTAGSGPIDDLASKTACVVRSVASDGCVYPQPLEAAYRFIVDPSPYQSAKVDCAFGSGGDVCGTNKIDVSGVDDEILAERKAFLRPDSELVVLYASALDDMSLKPAQLNWLPWAYGKGQMQRGWSACSSVPDDFEPDSGDEFNTLHATYGCFSCFENAANPACSMPWPTSGADVDVDARSLRNFAMTQRWGYNFLYGRQRYVDGFSDPVVPGIDPATGAVVGEPNPIFAGGLRTRDLVDVVAFVGSADLSSPKNETEWQKLVSADPSVRDPHMIPSIAPRVGMPKFAGDVGVDATNGGDRDVPNGDELQWACIGKSMTPGPTPRCAAPGSDKSDPLCGAGGTQLYFGATPALRIARVTHALGPTAHMISVCGDDPGAQLEVEMEAIVGRFAPR